MMMKFTCNTGELNQGINSALLAVSPKSTLLALEGILVRVTTKEITLMSYNLEMGITAIVDAKVEKTGEIIIPAKVFSDIIRRIESDEVTIEADDRCLVQITGGVSQFTILGMTSEEFPELPEVGEAQGFSIPMETLSSMVDMTRYAIATNDTKPVQTGCLFELQDDELVVVAVDGFRLALRREKVEHHEPMRFIVPGKTLGELLKLIGEEGNVVVEASRKHILFDMGNCTLVSRLLEGDFLDWKRVVPTGCPIKLIASVSELAASVDRVGLIVSEKYKSPIRCTFANQELQMRTSTTIGSAEDKCSYAGDGQELEIGFNVRYMADALRAIPSEEVTLELTNGLSPIVLTPVDQKHDFAYMILPVRIKG